MRVSWKIKMVTKNGSAVIVLLRSPKVHGYRKIKKFWVISSFPFLVSRVVMLLFQGSARGR